ncbi:MAG TPA: D-2-hydroxyacid dehydrogenase [Thermomicrobiales bacterium]|nr:D-2-hydroxyacid dehydrogenase [Thermomicrobiales bacterium]
MRRVAPERVTVIHDEDLIAPARFVADHDGIDGFTLTAEQQARWSAHLAKADVLWDFRFAARAGAHLLDLAPNVKWVQTTSAGVGPLVNTLGLVDTDVIVTTASGVHSEPLAEFVFLALLMHAKELRRLQGWQEAAHWERFCSDELDGRTLAIVGPGKIGRQVAKVGKAFGMRVSVMGSRGGDERRAELGVDAIYTRDRLHEMLASADAVVLCCPHTPETEGMIDGAAFAAMKPGVSFVNISRGQVVDEGAMIEALRSGQIGFAALDVFATEPLPADSPLWSLENVLVSPHSGSTANSENGKITDIFCHNLTCLLDGRHDEMRNVLDKARMY